jgi:hypothetical protein
MYVGIRLSYLFLIVSSCVSYAGDKIEQKKNPQLETSLSMVAAHEEGLSMPLLRVIVHHQLPFKSNGTPLFPRSATMLSGGSSGSKGSGGRSRSSSAEERAQRTHDTDTDDDESLATLSLPSNPQHSPTNRTQKILAQARNLQGPMGTLVALLPGDEIQRKKAEDQLITNAVAQVLCAVEMHKKDGGKDREIYIAPILGDQENAELRTNIANTNSSKDCCVIL